MDTERRPSIPITEEDEGPRTLSKRDSFQKLDSENSLHEKLFNLYIKALSWPMEGRGLLHTLSPLVYSKDYKIRAANGVYYVARDDSQLSVVRSSKEISSSEILIAKLDVTSNGIILEAMEYGPDAQLMSQSEMWEEVPKSADGVVVKKGNVLRFGSYKVKVVDIALTPEELSTGAALRELGVLKPFVFSDSVSEVESSLHGSEYSATGPVCRICFEAGDDPKNLLVSPCVCSGSLRYIHVDCLRRWLDGQLQVKQFENGGGSYFIRAINCEICKSTYSKSVYQSILIPRPSVPHIILEDFILSSPNQPTSKIHIIPLAQRPIRIGRSKENDIVLSDISVSRMHAVLSLHESSLRVTDLSSKFGSLIQLPSRIFHLSDSPPLRVQLGSALVEILASHPGRFEKLIPERFLQDKGVVKLMKAKSPNDRLVEADRVRRNRSSVPLETQDPTSPAATLNASFFRPLSPSLELDPAAPIVASLPHVISELELPERAVNDST